MMKPVGTSADTSSEANAPGRAIVRADVIGTALFVVSATVAAVVFTGPVRVLGVVVALALFAAGVFAFLWSYITAVNRSRTDNIAVAQLYFLVSGSTPKPVRRVMSSALAVQVVVAFTTAIARSRTDGRAGSTLAFGILVPMFGLGLNGLWCSKHGSFTQRAVQTPAQADATAPARAVDVDDLTDDNRDDHRDNDDDDVNSEGVPPSDEQMEQNSPHG
jgi:hypothetical protein